MPAVKFLTWDGDPDNSIPPYRPGTEDLGGDTLEDDVEFPPDDGEMPTADAWNQIVRQVVAMGRMTSSARISVHFASGTPVVSGVVSPRNGITAATFTVTDNGTGDTTIAWPGGSFPAAVTQPNGFTLNSADTGATTAYARVEKLTNAIRVRTNLAGAAADIDFTVNID